MSLITWSDSFSVNVKAIDDQHKKLIDMINALNDAMRQGKGRDVLGKIVDGLVSYTSVHFAYEEKCFKQFAYPDAETHVKEHKAFVQKVTDFKSQFDNGTVTLSVPVMNFLSDWLKKHIQGTDQKYSACFNENGLS